MGKVRLFQPSIIHKRLSLHGSNLQCVIYNQIRLVISFSFSLLDWVSGSSQHNLMALHKHTRHPPPLHPNLPVKARVYYSDSVIRNPTPSPWRPLEPSQFSVGMSDTRRNPPPDQSHMLTTNHVNSV